MSDDAELEALHFTALRLHSVLLVKIHNIMVADIAYVFGILSRFQIFRF